MRKEMKVPYKPMLDCNDDTKHFDTDICKIPIESPSQHSLSQLAGNRMTLSSGGGGEDDEFDGFTFEAQTVLSGEATGSALKFIHFSSPSKADSSSAKHHNRNSGSPISSAVDF